MRVHCTSLQNNLQQIVERANLSGASIRAILLSTTEGVPLGRVYANNDQPLNEEVLASIESVWAPASKQLPVLGMDKVHQVTAIYDHGVLVNVYQGPMVRLYAAGWSGGCSPPDDSSQSEIYFEKFRICSAN